MCGLRISNLYIFVDIAHRKHASVVGIPPLVSGPCAAGLLMAREVKYLCNALPLHPARTPQTPSDAAPAPLAAAVVGGVKVDSKLPVLENLLKRVDTVLVGGAMALPFLVATGALPDTVPVPPGVDLAASTEQARAVIAHSKEAGVDIVLPRDFVILRDCRDPAETGEVPETLTLEQISQEVRDKSTSQQLQISTRATSL